jgi:hypothetical protein
MEIPDTLRTIILCALLLCACGQIRVVEADVNLPTDSAATDASPDSSEGVDIQSADTAITNDVIGNDCLTDFDCLDKIQGKTPCILAKCSAGFCVKMQKATGSTCKDAALTPGDCGQTTCDDLGQCVIGDVKDGTVCGAGLCGKKCAGGDCIPATDADYTDGNPCTKDYCDQGIQIKHEPITDLTIPCDDNDACTASDTCIQGACQGTAISCADGIACTLDTCASNSGCAHTSDNNKCDDANPCTVDGCDLALGCTVTGLAVGVTCSDGNECTISDACDGGGSCSGQPSDTCKCASDDDCIGKAQNLCIGALVCQDGNCAAIAANAVYCDASANTTCLHNACDPGSGKCLEKSQNEGGPCDDANACTNDKKCQGGACQGVNVVDCDDKNACTNDLCLPQSGCVHEVNSAACDDGNACTAGDTCANGGCSGAAKPCDDSIACTLDGCDKGSGTCTHATDTNTCDDGNPCTIDTCIANKGCSYANDDAANCDDGNACTANTCQGGLCSVTPICACNSDAECDDKNPCTAESCVASKCQFQPQDGGACDPADKCQTPGSGKCGGGVCKAGNSAKDCGSLNDACHSGACDPGTGQCGALPKGNGTPCDADQDPCSVADACEGGACLPGKAFDCSAVETQNFCEIGVCVNNGGAPSCTAQAKLPGTPCEDGAYCTIGDSCDVSGLCTGGGARTCSEFSDACNTGMCDEGMNACGKAPKGVDVGCDDSAFCTALDHCNGSGSCVGGGVTACPGSACATGSCDGASETCVLVALPAETTCSDGDPCTLNDACDNGGHCLAGQAVACQGTTCSAGACDPTTGGCVLLALNATATCDDGQKCTIGDHCDGFGACAGGSWDASCGCNQDATCNDGNACTIDTCDSLSGTCQFQTASGQACDDGEPCSTASACNSDGACVATALFDCSSANDTCHVGQCASDGKTQFCKAILLGDGSKCDDGLFCTTGETCTSGQCGNGSAVVCTSAIACFTAVCSEAAQGCSSTSAAKGTACSDGEACTLGDTCDGAGVCLAGGGAEDFAICDDGDANSSGDLCLNAMCAGFVAVADASGPMTRVVYDSTSDAWWFSSALKADTSVANAKQWSISQVAIDASGGWSLAKLAATLNTGPIRALSPQIAGGANNFTAFHVPGSKTWVAGSNAAFGKSATAAFTSATEWYDVDFRSTGSNGFGLLVGGDSALGSQLGRCQGPWGDTTSTWTCNSHSVSGAWGVGAGISFFTSSCLPACAPSASFIGGLQKWNGSVASQLDTVSAPLIFSSWSALNAGPTFKLSSSLLTGGLYAYDTSSYTATGSTTVWTVGPSGSLAFIANGSSTLKGIALYGTNYQFTDVMAMAGYVLVWGYKTDAKTGNFVPVLLTHLDSVNTQTDATSWIEHDLALPQYDVKNCVNSGLSSYGMANGGSKGTTLALVANYCGNTVSANPPDLKGMIYLRK